MKLKLNMTDQELIIKLTKENIEMKQTLESNRESACDIIARLINVGAPLNDNLLGFNKEQRSFLFDIKHLAEAILDSD